MQFKAFVLLLAPALADRPAAQMGALRLTNVDGSTYGYLRVPDSPTLKPQCLTLEAWIAPLGNGYGNTTVDTYGADLVARADDVVPAGLFVASWAMRWSPLSERININLDDGAQHGTYVFSNAVVPLNTSAHVAMTFDGERIRLYVNGVLDSDVPWPSPIYYETGDVVWIGTGEGPGGYLRRFDGIIDSVRLWDRARTPSEILGAMNCESAAPQAGLLASWSFDSGSTVDSSGNGNHATAGGPGVSLVPEPVVLPNCVPPDVVPPILSCPAVITQVDSKSGVPGAIVYFTVFATDDVDPAPSISCVPPPGSSFPRGTTIVNCTATDASGNHSFCSFPVIVRPTAREHRL